MAAIGPTRRPLVVANWKMNLTRAELAGYVAKLVAELPTDAATDVALAPAAIHIPLLAELVSGAPVQVYAQNCHDASKGAYTGEISVAMLREADVEGVIIGHSERRHGLGEPEEWIARKLAAAVSGGLTVILCVGETLQERESAATAEVIRGQLRSALSDLAPRPGAVVIAYEPVWAIGTGRNATATQISEVVSDLRSELGQLWGEAACSVRVLYGGSVTPDSARELPATGVDGALVGSAGLDPFRLVRIVRAM